MFNLAKVFLLHCNNLLKELTTLTKYNTGVVLLVTVHSFGCTIVFYYVTFHHYSLYIILNELNQEIFYKGISISSIKMFKEADVTIVLFISHNLVSSKLLSA